MKEKERYFSPETEVIQMTLEMGCMSVTVDAATVDNPFSGNVEDIW